MSLDKITFNKINQLLDNSDNWVISGISHLSGRAFWIKETNTGIKIWTASGFWFCNFYDESRYLGNFGLFDKIRLYSKVNRILKELHKQKVKELFSKF